MKLQSLLVLLMVKVIPGNVTYWEVLQTTVFIFLTDRDASEKPRELEATASNMNYLDSCDFCYMSFVSCVAYCILNSVERPS